MDCAARDRLVEPADERAMLFRHGRGVATVVERDLEPPKECLDRRAVAAVLEPLALGGSDALLLLLDVRHRGEEMPAIAGVHDRTKGEAAPPVPPSIRPGGHHSSSPLASLSSKRAQGWNATVPKLRP